MLVTLETNSPSSLIILNLTDFFLCNVNKWLTTNSLANIHCKFQTFDFKTDIIYYDWNSCSYVQTLANMDSNFQSQECPQ